MSPCGILLIHKPAGMSSRQAVNAVQRLSRPAKAGHAGTLDPLAEGLLVVCVGGATRLIEYVQRMPKQYVGTFLLGRQSPTEDIEGEITELPKAPIPTLENIEHTALQFLGRIEQRPPAFSALKLQGRPAYKLARQGMTVELAARPVEIHRIDVVAYRYPELVLDITCGSGTYVRSLGRDVAAKMGTAAVMSALRRTRIGEFRLENAIHPQALTPGSWRDRLLPPLRAVEYLPQIKLTPEQAKRIRNGLTITLEQQSGQTVLPSWEEIAAIDPEGRLIGILGPSEFDCWRPLRNLPTGTV